MPKISLIIPAYNEEKRIEKTLKNYIAFFKKKFSNFEIIVVTDGCKDNTPKIVEKLSKRFSFIKHIHPLERLGKGGAIIEGFKLANGNIIGFVDADGSTPSQSISSLIENLNGYDGAIASRWVDGAIVRRKEPFARRIASRCFNYLVRMLFGFHFKDTQCGAKFFRRKAIKSVVDELRLTDWAFDVDLLYRLNKKGFKIKEVPIVWNYKKGSKINLIDASIMFVSIFRLKFKR
jgi:glycosyltransferase involved in cell wall biosynthesis